MTQQSGRKQTHGEGYCSATAWWLLSQPHWRRPSACRANAAPQREASALGLKPIYRNPILFADYSDPDVIRDGANYYLVASTFHFVPGIPILQSTDLVHWTIVGHVVQRLTWIRATA